MENNVDNQAHTNGGPEIRKEFSRHFDELKTAINKGLARILKNSPVSMKREFNHIYKDLKKVEIRNTNAMDEVTIMTPQNISRDIDPYDILTTVRDLPNNNKHLEEQIENVRAIIGDMIGSKNGTFDNLELFKPTEVYNETYKKLEKFIDTSVDGAEIPLKRMFNNESDLFNYFNLTKDFLNGKNVYTLKSQELFEIDDTINRMTKRLNVLIDYINRDKIIINEKAFKSLSEVLYTLAEEVTSLVKINILTGIAINIANASMSQLIPYYNKIDSDGKRIN